MKSWKIPVTWEMCGIVTVEADRLEEAMEKVRRAGNISLPQDGIYVDSTLDLSMNEDEEIRSCFNNNQKDEGDS